MPRGEVITKRGSRFEERATLTAPSRRPPALEAKLKETRHFRKDDQGTSLKEEGIYR